eukprot:2242648-Pleurochrysis_carterae.AAC.3
MRAQSGVLSARATRVMLVHKPRGCVEICKRWLRAARRTESARERYGCARRIRTGQERAQSLEIVGKCQARARVCVRSREGELCAHPSCGRVGADVEQLVLQVGCGEGSGHAGKVARSWIGTCCSEQCGSAESLHGPPQS